MTYVTVTLVFMQGCELTENLSNLLFSFGYVTRDYILHKHSHFDSDALCELTDATRGDIDSLICSAQAQKYECACTGVDQHIPDDGTWQSDRVSLLMRRRGPDSSLVC